MLTIVALVVTVIRHREAFLLRFFILFANILDFTVSTFPKTLEKMIFLTKNDYKQMTFLLHPPPLTLPNQSRKLGGTARRRGEFRNAQRLLYSNAPAYLARKPPSHTHKQTHWLSRTHTNRKVVWRGERAQPPSRMFTECFAFYALSHIAGL